MSPVRPLGVDVMIRSNGVSRASIVFLIVLSLTAAVDQAHGWSSRDTLLRILVLKDKDSIALRVKGPYRMYICGENSKSVKKGLGLFKTAVAASTDGISIGKKVFPGAGCIRVVPMAGSSVMAGRRAFAGALDLMRTPDGKMTAVNRVDVEDYLKGVLQREVSARWPMEALKAQAIASRTYALYTRSTRQDKDYDLTDDTYSQVYGGRGSYRVKTNIAVYLTRGKVLTFDGKIFPAYFHSTCGGRTEDASNIWNIDIEPLKGRRSDFCKESPHYRWEFSVASAEIRDGLIRAGHSLAGDIRSLEAAGKTSTGRVKDVKIVSDNDIVIPAEEFRLAVGPNCVKSTDFAVQKKGADFIFSGRGWGHGVGMCQWGAYFLAKKSYKARDILKHYYPKAKIESYETVGL